MTAITSSSIYLKEVARFLGQHPHSAADELIITVPQNGRLKRPRRRPHSSTMRRGVDNEETGKNITTVVSTWSPVPGTATNSECDNDESAKRILAYRNGDRLCGVWIHVRSFQSVLRKATMKLRLPRPARRVFAEDGTEAYDVDCLSYGGAVFISMGEEFKGAQLTSFQMASGRVASATYGTPKRQITTVARLNELVGSVASRILVLRNGDSLPDGDLSEVAVNLNDKSWLRTLFIQATVRLVMSSYARQLFDMNGRLITSPDELPELSPPVLAHITDGKAYGPVWVGHGDEFRPNAAIDFAKKLRKRINKTLKIRKVGIDITIEEHEELENFKPRLNELIGDLQSISPVVHEPRPPSAGTTFECLRLKIFENGVSPSSSHFRNVTFPLSDVIRRLPSRRDEVAVLKALHAYCGETARSKKIQRLFTSDGNEVTTVRVLENDQSVWCSGGENFIPYSQPVLAITLDQVRVYRLAAAVIAATADKGLLSADERQAQRLAVREQLPAVLMETLNADTTRSGWTVTTDWAMKTDVSSEELSDIDRVSELLARAGSLRSAVVQVPKSKRIPMSFSLCAELKIQLDQRFAANKADLGPLLQKWLIDEKGYIRPRVLPQLALSVDAGEEIVGEITVNGEKKAVPGCRRVLLLPISSAADRRWTFTSDGRIQSTGYSNLVLTFTGVSFTADGDDGGDGGGSNANKRGGQAWMIAAPRHESNSQSQVTELQQWALRPTACWEKRPKTAKRLNPEWHMRAFWWPTSDYNFAGQCVSVNLIAKAPPITRTQDAGSLGVNKKRIFVLPNGCDDLSRAVPIVVSDLRTTPHCDVSFDSFDNPSRDPTVRHFLSSCTTLLSLPSAARRIFNTNGQELSNLDSVESDQLLYISTGEKYIDIMVTEEHRRTRFLRQMLSADAAKLRAFCALHSPYNADMVVGFEGTAEPGTKLVILPVADTSSDLATLSARTSTTTTSSPGTSNSTVVGEGLLKRRFLHARFRIVEDGYMELMATANKALCLTVSPKESMTRDVTLELRRPDDPLQQWTIDKDGLIRSRYQTRFVLAIQIPDILTNSVSPFGSGVSPLVGSSVGVQQLRAAQFGRANQLFRFDRGSGRLFPFAANQRDLDITAASASGICTGSVCSEEVDQIGYELDRTSIPPSLASTGRDAFKALTICSSCARAVRGCGCQLSRVTKARDFRCALSEQTQRQLFLAACGTRSPTVAASLGATVRTLYTLDLSGDSVAEDMLGHWEQQLFELTKSQQVEPNQAPSAAVVNAPLMWILARAVGTGIETGPPPVLVAGRSIDELLGQCTEKLGLAFAARSMYAKDGARIVDTHAISDWIAEHDDYITERARILAAQRCPDLMRLLQPDEYGHASPIESTFWARPVEVWVSDAKAFEKPEDVDKKVSNLSMRFKDEHRQSYQFDTERSRLKGMEARRKNLLTDKQFVSTEDPNGPVALEGGWKARAAEEVQLANRLQVSSRTSRGAETARSASSGPNNRPSSAREVITDDQLLRIRAYENGGNPESAVFVWGATIEELLRNATTRLVLRRPAKRLFALPTVPSGDTATTEVTSMRDMVRDQIIAVSTGLGFISAQSARGVVNVKAEWARVRRDFGPSATDMPVVAQDLKAQSSTRGSTGKLSSSSMSIKVEEPLDDC